VDRVLVPDPTAGPEPSERRVLRFESVASSHPGAVRDDNEDFVFAGTNLLAVADGVGGNVFGEVASEIVITAIAYLEDPPSGKDPGVELRDAVEHANDCIARAAGDDPSRAGMATTLAALRLDGAALMVVHVGDSRAYRLRNGELTRLTRDDSLVQELVDAGAITEAEARRHPARSVVVQALNGGPNQPHVRAYDALVGDRYLVCSDGLTDYVDEPAIHRILADVAELSSCCPALIDAALAVGGPDNVSCVVGDVRPI
jgi:serine/threonine protein phosphatase PrpC